VKRGKDRVKKKAVKQAARKTQGAAKSASTKKNVGRISKRRPAAAVSKNSHAGAGKAPGRVARAKLPEGQKKILKDLLFTMRERILGQIRSLKGDSLRRDDEVNNAEDGTDAFERQFALNLVSSENDAVFEIDEALQRLEEGIYGVCEDCAGLIEMPRLKALPFVRKCVGCQSKSEAGKIKFRPLPAAEEI
jgi:RNA polymerase-binding transcription factor DksA